MIPTTNIFFQFTFKILSLSQPEKVCKTVKKMLVAPENLCHFFNQVSSAKVEGKPSNPLIPLASFARFVVPLCLALYLVISNQDFMPMWFFHYANHVVYSIHSGPSEVSENMEGGRKSRYI